MTTPDPDVVSLFEGSFERFWNELTAWRVQMRNHGSDLSSHVHAEYGRMAALLGDALDNATCHRCHRLAVVERHGELLCLDHDGIYAACQACGQPELVSELGAPDDTTSDEWCRSCRELRGTE